MGINLEIVLANGFLLAAEQQGYLDQLRAVKDFLTKEIRVEWLKEEDASEEADENTQAQSFGKWEVIDDSHHPDGGAWYVLLCHPDTWVMNSGKTQGTGGFGYELGTEFELPEISETVKDQAEQIWKILRQSNEYTQPPQFCLYSSFH